MNFEPEFQKVVPGVAGSVLALLFLRDGWMRNVFTFAGGVAIAHFCGPTVATFIKGNLEIAGFVTGLFGMSIVAKIFDMIFAFDVTQVLSDLVKAAIKRIGG